MNLQPPDEHQLLVFWVSLLLLVAVARTLGRLAQRLGQPAVVGELAAGLLLGPSVLGKLAPDMSTWLFPGDQVQTAMLFTIAWIGAVMLLISTGFETDLKLLRSLGPSALVIVAGTLLLPLLMGFLTGLAMPSLFVGTEGDGLLFAMFMAVALAISALPVLAKILSDMRLMRRRFGQLMLAAGMADDVAGWLLLGVVAALAQAGTVDLRVLLATTGALAVFYLGSFTVGQWLVDRALRFVRRSGSNPVHATTTVLVLAIMAGSLTHWIGVEVVLGAFVAGMLLGRSRFSEHRMILPLRTISEGFFAPVFFATAGLRVDLALLREREVLIWGLVVLVVAAASKFGGALAGGRWARLPFNERVALGVGLNARGAVEIVIASVGLSLAVLNQASYTVVVLMAMVTSMMTPPLLRLVLRRWEETPEELDRLRREETLGRNLVVRAERLLLPSRGGPGSIIAAQILDLVWPIEVPATVVTAGPSGSAGDLTPVHNVLGERPTDFHRVRKGDEAVSVLKESRLGYGAIGVGLRGDSHSGKVLSPFVEELVVGTDLPVVIVRGGRAADRALPWAYGIAVVPVSGTEESRAAQEVAMNLSARIGTEIVLTHVTDRSSDAGGSSPTEPPAISARLLGQVSDEAAETGARWHTAVRYGESTSREVLELVEELEADLVVVGASRREVEGGAFLGQTVERLLTDCPVTVVVVVTPA